MFCHVTHTVSLGCLWAHWPSLALWPSILLARWPIVELASSINIPQWHLTKYTHVELEINEQIKLTKAGENYVASTIRTMLAWRYNLCALRMVRCKTIDLFFTTSLESQECYLTTGMLPYKHVSWSLENFSVCTVLSHCSIMPCQPRVFAQLARWQWILKKPTTRTSWVTDCDVPPGVSLGIRDKE